MKNHPDKNLIRWDTKGCFDIDIGSNKGLADLNAQNLIPVAIDTTRSDPVSIKASGSIGKNLILWSIDSVGSCLRQPRENRDIISFGFITGGDITMRCHSGDRVGVKNIALILDYNDYIESETSNDYCVIAGAIKTRDLIKTSTALTGDTMSALPSFLPSADMELPGIAALMCTIRSVHNQSQVTGLNDDFTLSLIQEIIGYQLLTAWPKEVAVTTVSSEHVRPDRLNMAIEYIKAHLSSEMMLSDIAAAAGLSVRTLQTNFRRSVGQTPFQYIINSRLTHVHQDLLSKGNEHLSVKDIAKRRGFVHMSDFGQRYRLMYGCTPSQTRQNDR